MGTTERLTTTASAKLLVAHAAYTKDVASEVVDVVVAVTVTVEAKNVFVAVFVIVVCMASNSLSS